MAIYEYDGIRPDIDPDSFIFESADVIGQVSIAAGASVWGHVSIRADNDAIHIGRNSNVQEGSVLHVDPGTPLVIGENVTIGHQAMLHGCSIADGSLIGMQAIILNRARIGRNCLIAAGALVPENRDIPDNSLVMGIGKIARLLTPAEIDEMHQNTQSYVVRSQHFRRALRRIPFKVFRLNRPGFCGGSDS